VKKNEKKISLKKVSNSDDSDTEIDEAQVNEKLEIKKFVNKIKKNIASSANESKSSDDESNADDENDPNCADNKFETFQKICFKISKHSSHLEKTDILRKFFKNGIEQNKNGYQGDMYLFVKLLLPSASTRVFNLNSKQLIKLFSKIFNVDLEEMSDHLNKGDASETCSHYFNKSNTAIKPCLHSTLNLKQVDSYLDKLTQLTKENEQMKFLEDVTKKCTINDLKMFIRLIKKDLKIDAMAKIILDSVAPNAYQAFQVSRDLKNVIQRAKERSNKHGLEKSLSIKVNLMTPIKPMLADACKSVEQAFLKFKNSILAEIKYDGERLQVHKNGTSFNYFSRNLKQVQPHKVSHLKEFIPKAFPNAIELIIDAEVLLYDCITKKPLPFGTLGVHKVRIEIFIKLFFFFN
jgi:DNA ligase-3